MLYTSYSAYSDQNKAETHISKYENMQKQNLASSFNKMLALVWKMHSKNHELYMQKYSHSQSIAKGTYE